MITFEGLRDVLGRTNARDEACTPVAEMSSAKDLPGGLDDPRLLELDRGVYSGGLAGRAVETVPQSDPGATIVDDALIVGGEVFGAQERGTSTVSEDLPPHPTRRPEVVDSTTRQPSHEGHVDQLTAAMVLILAMLLGASGAVAVFHDRVTQVFEKLENRRE
jgi:hypothetical protein